MPHEPRRNQDPHQQPAGLMWGTQEKCPSVTEGQLIQERGEESSSVKKALSLIHPTDQLADAQAGLVNRGLRFGFVQAQQFSDAAVLVTFYIVQEKR